MNRAAIDVEDRPAVDMLNVIAIAANPIEGDQQAWVGGRPLGGQGIYAAAARSIGADVDAAQLVSHGIQHIKRKQLDEQLWIEAIVLALDRDIAPIRRPGAALRERGVRAPAISLVGCEPELPSVLVREHQEAIRAGKEQR